VPRSLGRGFVRRCRCTTAMRRAQERYPAPETLPRGLLLRRNPGSL
jgi:hypothetical protein